MEIDYREAAEKIKAGYRVVSAQYRRDDEIEVTTENHRHLGQKLRDTCLSFKGPINVLDVGCGTGRYFHCLPKVARLVGLDVSDDMLAAAKNPVHAEQITARKIELIRENAFLASFPSESFHFIYSLGMFGHGCPVTVEICSKFYDWLLPGGKLFFNAVDVRGLPLCYRVRRRIKNLVYPVLTSGLRKVLDDRQNRSPLFFSMSRRQLKGVLAQTRFQEFEIDSYECLSPLWTGRHLECVASKRV